LRPGTYRFHVIASNNDGVWNEEGAALDFVVAPAWYQTRTFFVLSVMTGVLAVWVAFRLRVRQVAQALNARFDERLAERTRMARDIHDTLLQTVQGSKMVADAALTRRDDPAAMARAMEQVSSWLGQASTEGRAAVKALRTSATEANDLAEAFRRAIEDCRQQGSLEASIEVIGDPVEMRPRRGLPDRLRGSQECLHTLLRESSRRETHLCAQPCGAGRGQRRRDRSGNRASWPGRSFRPAGHAGTSCAHRSHVQRRDVRRIWN
jgi:hypothetical protein